MSDELATLLVRALVLVGAIGVLGRWLVRERAERALMRSWLQFAPYLYWVAVLVLAWHPVALPAPAWYDATLRPLGVALSVLAGGFAAWAALHLGRYWDPAISALRDHRVEDAGPFAVVRHPIYLGLVAFFVGGTLAIADPLAALATAWVATVAVLRARAEERFLIERVGEEYRAYRRRVPMLLPWPRP